MTTPPGPPDTTEDERWLTRSVASLLANIDQQVPTDLLPTLLTSNPGTPATRTLIRRTGLALASPRCSLNSQTEASK